MPDYGRPDFGRPDFGGDPSVDDIRRTDTYIDALAGGRSVVPNDAADAELAALLGGWRDELRWPPATGLVTEADAVAALNAGRAGKRAVPAMERWGADTTTPRRHRRGLSVLGAAAAAVLCIGGFGAVVAGSGPGDSLYGLRTMLFGESKQVRGDQFGLAAKVELAQVQDLIAQGDWEQAQNKLVAVSDQVASIGDQQQKQELLDQFNDLSAKVVERDPAATAPPGVVYTVPPSAAELVPAVAPPTTSSSGESAAATSAAPTSTTPTSTAATAATATSTAPTTPTTGTAPSTTGATTPATPTSAAAPPSSATAGPDSAAASSTAASPTQPITTPTSVAPSTVVSTPEVTTPAAPAAQSAGPAAPTTTPAAPPPPESALSPAPEAASPAAVPPPATSAPPPAQTPAATAEIAPSAGVTTTVLIPVPVG